MSPNKKGQCPKCQNIRRVSEHLIELAYAAEYLDNRSVYNSEQGSVSIFTTTIGEWLLLASRLEKVEVNAWKYDGADAVFCSPIADNLDQISNYFTGHATALTRFMFVCNSLEETYRFIDHLYLPLAERKKIPVKMRKRTSSLRAILLVDDLFDRLGKLIEPVDFDHHADNFETLFHAYSVERNVVITGIELEFKNKKTKALHLIRNLRNHVAHGTFPIGPPTDDSSEELIHLLNHGCRVAALYIQIILRGFCHQFESMDYKMMQDADAPECETFIKNFTLDYVKDIHLKNEFRLRPCVD